MQFLVVPKKTIEILAIGNFINQGKRMRQNAVIWIDTNFLMNAKLY
jgi:hypothetical protein